MRRNITRLKRIALLASFVTAVSACGGGGGGGGQAAPPTGGSETTKTGVFTDARVQGVRFLCIGPGRSNLEGMTNANGEYTFREGDSVTFMIGNVDLGTTPAKETVTPLDIAQSEIAEGSLPAGVEVSDYVTNLAVFLQTLDGDNNPDNGISIPGSLAASATTPINFETPLENFVAGNAGLQPLVDALESVDTVEGERAVVTAEAATEHLEQQARELLSNTWAFVDKQGNFANQTVTFFPDGHYLYGAREGDSNCAPDANTNTTFANNSSGNGMEYGRFEWDLVNNGNFTVRDLTIETNGTCGLNGSVDDEAADQPRLKLNGTRLVYSLLKRSGESCDAIATEVNGRCDYPMVLAHTLGSTIENSRQGSWLSDGTPAGYPVVTVYFGDTSGRYFMVGTDEDGNDCATPNPQTGFCADFEPGIETGNFSIGSGNALTVSNVFDTNGNGGYANDGTPFGGNPKLFVNPNNPRKLVFQDDFEIGTEDACADLDDCTATRIPLIGVGEIPPPPKKETLLGAWGKVEDDNTINHGSVLAFFNDGTYVLGAFNNQADCNKTNPNSTATNNQVFSDTNGNGIEYGKFSWNEQTGAFSVGEGANHALIRETDGFCGFNEPIVGSTNDTQKMELSADGNELTFTEFTNGQQIGQYKYRRHVSTPGTIFGGFLVAGTLADNGPTVVVFSAIDNQYVMADAGNLGVEHGCFSVASDGTLNLTLTPNGQCEDGVDTNEDAGFSHPFGGSAKLTVLSDQKLRYKEAQDQPDGDSDATLIRLPLLDDDVPTQSLPRATTADLIGAWYISGESAPRQVSPAASTDYFAFFSDGQYITGSQNNDPNCDADYGNPNPDQSQNGPLDRDGLGSEYANWSIGANGVLEITGPARVDSNGSCGLFSTNPADVNAPDEFIEKVDADTLKLTFFEKQDGGTGETNTGEYLPVPVFISRIPTSASNPLTGAWTVNVTTLGGAAARELWLFFDNGKGFYADADENGGVERYSSISLNSAQSQLSVAFGGPAADCVDTIGSNNGCANPTADTIVFPFTFSNAGKTQFSITDGDEFTAPPGAIYTKISP